MTAYSNPSFLPVLEEPKGYTDPSALSPGLIRVRAKVRARAIARVRRYVAPFD